jgi:DNA ligase 4
MFTFIDICALLEKFERITTKSMKRQTKRFQCRKAFQQFLQQIGPINTDDMSRMFRCLTPSQDKSRKYSIQEAKLVQLLMKICIKDTIEGRRLLKWKNDSCEFRLNGNGDLGAVVGQVFDSVRGKEYSLCKVTDLLHELALTSSWSTVERNGWNPRNPDIIIRDLFHGQPGICCKWLTRIILKNLSPIQMDWEDFMFAFHPMMTSIFRMQADLFKTCEILHKAILNGHAAECFYEHNGKVFKKEYYSQIIKEYCVPVIGTFISCMECVQAKSISHVYEEMERQGIEMIAELKYDGERMQIHIEKDDITIFSKSGRNSTVDRILSHEYSLC